MENSDIPAPEKGIMLTHFFTVKDQDRSREFYKTIFDGKVVNERDPVMIKIANSWIILNAGGGPTEDKPEVYLSPPSDLNQVNSFLNVRVSNISRVYEEWKAKGAEFLTPPKEFDAEYRCYMRDPDGYIIEVGQMKG